VTKRLDGDGKPGQYPRDPYDWYREPPEAVDPLFDAIDFGDDLIFDPSCGGGNILDVAKRRGHPTVGGDIVDRHPCHTFHRGNYLQATRFPSMPGRALSIVNNPPYNYVRGIALQFILRTLDVVPFHRAAFLLPIEFTTGQERYRELYSKRPPSHVGFLMKRPSMPPGALVADMGDDAYRGGMADYVWIVWTAGGPYRTEALFLPPSAPRLPQRPKRRGIIAAMRGL
jgi:hypothetical protein